KGTLPKISSSSSYSNPKISRNRRFPKARERSQDLAQSQEQGSKGSIKQNTHPVILPLILPLSITRPH
ncbi:hypothetical protein LINPERHAP1_LOCUS13891, partial [Linum perenne]